MPTTRRLIAALAMIALLFGNSPLVADAQEALHLAIHQVDDADYPLVRIHLTVTDASGQPVTGRGADSFSASQDQQGVTSFTLAEVTEGEQPIYVVLAIDTSDSMRAAEPSVSGEPATAMQNARSAALEFVRSLGGSDQVAVVGFADEATVVLPLSSDPDSVAAAINGLQPRGGTAMHDAIAVSVGLLRDLPAGRKAVILLSDGKDSKSALTFEDAIDQAQDWSIPIYPIAFGAPNQNAVERIARLTGGYGQVKPDSSGLADAFAKVLGVLRHQYVMELTSSLPADGRTHALAVAVEIDGVRASAEAHFTARPREVSVELTGLADGQVLGGDVTLTPSWVAPGSLIQVEYQLDGGRLGVAAEPPFALNWDSTLVEPGEHVLTVTATDAVGNTGGHEYRITVRPPVIVSWVFPKAGAALSGSQDLEVEIDSLARVARVEFLVDDILVGAVTSAPYRMEWMAQSAAAGLHRLRAIVTDAKGKTGTAEIEVTVGLRSSLIPALVLGAVLAAGLVIIPLSVRRRRRLVATLAADAAPGQRVATLTEIEGLEPGKAWPVSRTETRLGRKRGENDIQAIGRSASRRHALIRFVQGEYVLFDLNPANPTLVNGEPARTQHILRTGDQLQIGDSIFRFHLGSTERAE